MGEVVRYRRAPRRAPKQRRGKPGRSWPARIITALIGGGIIAGIAYSYVGAPMTGCDIKGNVSVNTGERIYHVPGQEYYRQTRIDLLSGERWFCSEQEARAAGWRRSRV